MARFRSFGLTIESPVPLGLPDAEPGGTGSVWVSYGDVLSPTASERPEGDGCWQATPARALYFWPDVGAFEVSNGTEIVMDPAEGVDEDTLRLTLLGPLLATILHQRGFLVLHASGIRGTEGAIAVCAHSGTGKSTTAATLADHGYTLLTDDLLVIELAEEGPVICPGGASVKLWDASAEALGLDPDALSTIGERYTKRRLPVQPGSEPTPLQAVYILTRGVAQPPRELRRSHAVIEIMSRSYCSELLRLVGTERNLEQASALVRHIPVLQLERGDSFEKFDSWREALHEDVRDRIGDPA